VQLKNIVIDLSVDVWHNYINQQKDIASVSGLSMLGLPIGFL
jgi:hypothetical protein